MRCDLVVPTSTTDERTIRGQDTLELPKEIIKQPTQMGGVPLIPWLHASMLACQLLDSILA